MRHLTLLFALTCMVLASARHIENTQNTSPRHHSTTRHRRRRWQNLGYDFNSPPPYYQDRRTYDRQNDEVIHHIFRLLEDISLQLKRQKYPMVPAQPQPIYIPYPVPYPALSTTPCTPYNTFRDYPNDYNSHESNNPAMNNKPNITSRFPAMEDTNQNWGFVVADENDENSDGARPISFDPIAPKQAMKIPAPPVDHNVDSQSAMSQSENFDTVTPQPKAGGICNAAVLSCCGFSPDKQQQRQCFSSIGCGASYDNGNPCSPSSIQEALDSFKVAYAPL